jgi:hypothetical protein
VQLYLDLVDPVLRRRIRILAEQLPKEPVETPTRNKPVGHPGTLLLEPRLRGIRLPTRPMWSLGFVGGREVVLLDSAKRVRIPIPVPGDHLTLLVLGGIIEPGTPVGEYEVVALQRDEQGHVDGSVGFVIRVGKA